MNAYELQLPSGGSSGVWVCGECRFTHRSHHFATECCAPNFCDECQRPCARGQSMCDACSKAARVAQEYATYAKAKREPAAGYEGMLFVCDDHGHPIGFGDGFFQSVGEAEEWPEFDDARENMDGLHVYACYRAGMAIGAEDIIENGLQDAHEDAWESRTGVDELQALIDGWLEEHQIYSWHPDWSRVLVLDGETDGS